MDVTRVLCLHDAGSSASECADDFETLGDRLWTKHRIELTFVDAPLVEATATNDDDDDGDGELGGGVGGGAFGGKGLGPSRLRRRWFVEEAVDDADNDADNNDADNNDADNDANDNVDAGTVECPTRSRRLPRRRLTGLDASVLHLAQVWARRGGLGADDSSAFARAPFRGIVGVGQGGAIAALLPLLNCRDDDDDDDDEGGENAEPRNRRPPPASMFEGMAFAVVVDGFDVMERRGDNNNASADGDGDEESELYVGPEGIDSLHVIAEPNENDDKDADDDDDPSRRSARLARRFGPNAQIRRYRPPPTPSPSQRRRYGPSLANAVGAFLVSRKNASNSRPETRELVALESRLAVLERIATDCIHEEIARNPPKPLVAAILGRGSVGAWSGPRLRGEGEEGGGAPCPGEFLRKEGDRGS